MFIRWPFTTGRGNGKLLALRVCKLTCFNLPECWTGIEREMFTFRCWPAAPCFFFPPVFKSLERHDPFKWLFTCIRRRAKALLNELLSTIQLEWPSQKHSFPHYTMLSTASLQHRLNYEDQRVAEVSPAPTRSPILSLAY